MEAILACHPARSTEWLDCHPKSCELWRIRTGPIHGLSARFPEPSSSAISRDDHEGFPTRGALSKRGGLPNLSWCTEWSSFQNFANSRPLTIAISHDPQHSALDYLLRQRNCDEDSIQNTTNLSNINKQVQAQSTTIPWTKKKNHPRDSWREEPGCSTCDIMLDQARSAQEKSRTVADRTCPALIATDRAWYHTWKLEQRSSRRESRWWFFFLSRVVVLIINLSLVDMNRVRVREKLLPNSSLGLFKGFDWRGRPNGHLVKNWSSME